MKKNKFIYFLASIVAAPLLVSCVGDSIDTVNSPIAYEAIGGYENSDDIATSNLLVKLSFDNNLNDSKSNISGLVGTNVGYATGVKGNAYEGSSSEQRYAIGTSTAAVTSLNDFTIAFWMNTANTVADGGSPGQGKGAQGIFSIVRPTDFWGGINLFLENPDSANPNRLRLKIDIENGRSGVAWGSQGAIMNIDNSLNTWVHVVYSYNATNSTLSAYVNGKLATNLSSFAYAPAEGVAGVATLYADNPGSLDNVNNAPKYGNFEMKGTNNKVVFGTHQFDTMPALNNGSQQGWATSYVGMMDEFRIYNSSLSVNDVNALYLLEKNNR